ncbi:MAG TPA: PQQ-binding-like beta-propeller repeat protein [Candidatus Eremiobacteraceae bacterium]|nr:PQQ-binding-like beta-propeller repeat protein [Candidatus Eremiobacteraceae bacterium]
MSALMAAAIAATTMLYACSQKPQAAPTSTALGFSWPMYDGTYAGDRWSTLDAITAANAKSMKVVCSLALGETGAFQAGPVIVADTIYVTSMNDTYAIDATTCRLKWKSEYKPTGPVVFNTNRGVAYDDGTLFRDTEDAHLIALDAITGATKWDVKVADSSKGIFLSSAPIVWNGKIYAGLAGADWGVRGRMLAFDETDGHTVWSFDLIPEGAEAGASSWGRASTAATGGGSTWTSYALDTQTNEVFVPVGNPAPDFSGDYRPGSNLYTDSLVVLDANTGALKWYFQLVPHDIHDYDLGAPPILVTTKASKHLAVVSGKNGYLYAIDRATHAADYKVAVTTIRGESAAPTPQGTQVCPGWTGGSEWNSPAYDSEDNTIIVGTDDWCGTYMLAPPRYVAGKYFLGGSAIPAPWQQAHGWVTAIDADSGKVVWKYHTPGPALAAVSPTAGGLTFTGDMAGNFYALESKTGRVIYRYKTAGAIAGGIVAYQENGHEYVVSTSGNVSRSVWPGASGGMRIYVFSI